LGQLCIEQQQEKEQAMQQVNIPEEFARLNGQR
jgi:hypothetical protein